VYREIHLPKWPFRNDAFHFVGDGTVLVGGFPDCEGGGGLFVMHRPQDAATLFDANAPDSIVHRFPCLDRFINETYLSAWAATRPGVLGSKTCERWTADGAVVLAGDAAHAIQPYMGQGLNTGLEDVLVLQQCLVDTPSAQAALERYAALRKPEADAIRTMSDLHAQLLFGARSPQQVDLEASVQARLRALGWPDTYAAAAFTRTPFAEILKRENDVRNHLLATTNAGSSSAASTIV